MTESERDAHAPRDPGYGCEACRALVLIHGLGLEEVRQLHDDAARVTLAPGAQWRRGWLADPKVRAVLDAR